jgi:hypothetical protein
LLEGGAVGVGQDGGKHPMKQSLIHSRRLFFISAANLQKVSEKSVTIPQFFCQHSAKLGKLAYFTTLSLTPFGLWVSHLHILCVSRYTPDTEESDKHPLLQWG